MNIAILAILAAALAVTLSRTYALAIREELSPSDLASNIFLNAVLVSVIIVAGHRINAELAAMHTAAIEVRIQLHTPGVETIPERLPVLVHEPPGSVEFK